MPARIPVLDWVGNTVALVDVEPGKQPPKSVTCRGHVAKYDGEVYRMPKPPKG